MKTGRLGFPAMPDNPTPDSSLYSLLSIQDRLGITLQLFHVAQKLL